MGSNNRLSRQIAAGLHDEDRRAVARARLGVIVRAALILVVLGYMSWLFGAVSRLDADSLTRAAAATVESKLPMFRDELEAYAIAQAPAVTDAARDMFLEMPAQLRESLQVQLLQNSDSWIERFEREIDAAITGVVEHEFDLLRDALSDDTPERQLDALLRGISDEFRTTMIAALDEMYIDYAAEVRKLDTHLEHLQYAGDLTEAEQLDKQLLELWMVLVHEHGITDPLNVIETLQPRF